MKKIRIVSIVLILLSIVIIGIGVTLTYLDKEEKEDTSEEKEVKDNIVSETTICENITYEDKSSFLFTSHQLVVTGDYVVITSEEEFYSVASDYNYEDDLILDFDNYNYVIYFIENSNGCIDKKYVSDYSYENNVLIIEFTNRFYSENSKCPSVMAGLGYGIALDKNIDTSNLEIEVEEKEDPYKECYD